MAENDAPKTRVKPRYVPNRLGKDQLIDDENHLYNCNKRQGNRAFWHCAEKRTQHCPASASVVKTEKDGSEIEYVTFKGEHCHLSNLAKLKAKLMDQKTVKEALVNLSAAPSKVLGESTNKFKDQSTTACVLVYRRKSASIVRTIQRERAKLKGHTAVPMTMLQISKNPLPEQYTVTELGDPFLVLKDNIDDSNRNKCILMFMSSLQKELARLAKRWYSDGTFKCCPAPFSVANGPKGQIYTLFAELSSGAAVPVCFTILPDKTSASYQRMWAQIHEELTSHGQISLELESIGMDFEVAPKVEFDKVFEDVHMSGCFFHWRQALNRQLGKKGCQVFYNANVQFQDIVAKAVSLAYVPLEDVVEYAELIEQEWDECEEEMSDEAYAWLSYFLDTYVGRKNPRTGKRKTPKFSHKSWNKYAEIMNNQDTTSNKAEAWNGAYAVRSDANPSLWSTLDAFKREESLAVRKFREDTVSVRSQAPEPYEGTSRQIKQRERTARIKNTVELAHRTPKSEYLNLLSCLIRNLK